MTFLWAGTTIDNESLPTDSQNGASSGNEGVDQGSTPGGGAGVELAGIGSPEEVPALGTGSPSGLLRGEFPGSETMLFTLTL